MAISPKKKVSSRLSSVSGCESNRTKVALNSSVVATVRKTVSHTSFSRKSEPAPIANSNRGSVPGVLFDCTGNREDRQVHRNQKPADHRSQEDHQQWLNHGGEPGDCGIHLVVV